VRDRLNGTTERVSVDSSGNQGNNYSGSPWISGDGRYVAFTSSATNLVPGDTNGFDDIFVRDRQSGHTERVSIDSGGIQGNASSGHGAITGDGRYVVFDSPANNLVPGDTGSINDEFIHDRQSGLTERVSVSSAGVQGDHDSRSGMSSADGRYVVFYSFADNLVGGDTNANYDVFVRDRQSHTTEQVSSGPGDGPGAVNCSISADGRYVTFDALGAFVAGDTNGTGDSYLRDRQNATFELLSVDSAGGIGNGNTYGSVISADGRCVAFQSIATNFVSGDTNGFQDIFARDRTSVPAFTSLCDPGVGGVHACPCSNAPSGPGRGCNNSSATGGAVLSASGGTYVSSDTLVFTTSGEKPSVLSTVWQGPTSATAGIVYGQGVRCVNGSLRRLYHKIAAGGSITAPDFGAGDPTVSARSAALGVPIQPGQSRYYFVSYRDPIVLGGCPAGSTFNATQTGRVDWSF
jgi:hypothetical protein